MEVLLIAFLIGIFVVALLVTTAVMSRARNNTTDLLSDFDRMYYQDHGLRHS